MGAAIIDTNVLNSLFDNQKRLDDVFDSIFDDDNYFISSVCSTPSESRCPTYNTSRAYTPKPSPVRDRLLTVKEQYPYFFLLPVVLEIATMYVVVSHLL